MQDKKSFTEPKTENSKLKTIENDDSFYKTSKFDLILIILILFFSTFSILWISADQIRQPLQPKSAIIYQDNMKLEAINMSKDVITPILNGKMQVEVNKGKIRVLHSDCPQHICEKMGWIQNKGQTIVCIPNHILIEIKSSGSQSLDAISH
jgi:hypothetical protein